MNRPETEGLREAPAVRDYLLLSLVGLVVLALGLVAGDMGWWSLVPLSCGALGLLTSWGMFPPLLLLTLTGLELVRYSGAPQFRPRGDALVDILLAAGLLIHILGHYRLAALVRSITPAEARRARGGEEHPGNRDPATVRREEPALLLLGVVLALVAAFVAWQYLQLAHLEPWLGLPGIYWATFLLVALVTLFVVVFVAVLGYLGWQRATREECLLYLQDQVWSATRREQRRIQSWIAWARKRAARRGK